MRGNKPDARYGDELEQGQRRLARLKAAMAKVQEAYPHPAVAAAMKALRRELGI